MVADAQRRRQNAEDEEGLALRLELDVVGHRVRQQERRLEEHLRQEQPQQDRRVGGLAEALEVGGHPQLGEGDGAGAEVLGPVDAEGHGQGVEPQLAVSLDRFEVIDDGNSEAGDRVQDGTE